MNEITRIHIAKTAYDIEIAAKKQLEQYMKSLESYAKDDEVVTDIEIRITELLTERGVAKDGVISSEDIAAVRAQLGEPYEFASETGDIAVGPEVQTSTRRLYRSTDNAVLGGVLSGMAAYFNVNPLWTRLIFILLLFISFGTVLVVYIVLWIVIPPARTATEKLQLAGQDVTLESIKRLSAAEEKAQPSRIAPVLQSILSVGAGVISSLAALGTLAAAVMLPIAGMIFGVHDQRIIGQLSGFDDGLRWVAWVVMGITVFGLVLLASLFGLIAYAFFAKKLTKKMVISSVIIIVLGIASASTALGITAVQSGRVALETQNMMVNKKEALPKDFASVTSVTLEANQPGKEKHQYFSYSSIRYVVDNGPARYELTALSGAKVDVVVRSSTAAIRLDIPDTFRNAYVQPSLTIYGPALKAIDATASQVQYTGVKQDSLELIGHKDANLSAKGIYNQVSVKGAGSVSLDESTISSLVIVTDQKLSVSAGTVRELSVTQPDVCPTYAGQGNGVQVIGVTSGVMMLNGANLPAKTIKTNCASVQIGTQEY